MNRRRKEMASPAHWSSLEEQAVRMRRAPTTAEQLLWQELRGNKLTGLKFRRQHALARFIVDFYCVKAGLVIEVDGPIHDYQFDADKERTEYIESLGLKVLRFTNDDVVRDMDRVLTMIRTTASDVPPSNDSPLSSQGEGPGVR